MARHIFSILAITFIVSGIFGCAHSPKKKTLLYKNPENENQAKILEQKIQANPDDVKSRMELAKIYLAEDFKDPAIAELEKVLEIDSRQVQAYLLLSVAVQRGPKPDLPRAETLLETAIKIAPKNAEVHLNLAQVSDKLKKQEKAIAEFNQAIKLSSNPAILVSAHLGLMSIYQTQGESKKADAEYRKAKQIYPELDELLKQAEISLITPVPEYGGGELGEQDPLHPPLEQRIKKMQELIDAKQKGEKE